MPLLPGALRKTVADAATTPRPSVTACSALPRRSVRPRPRGVDMTTSSDYFPTDVAGLPAARSPDVVELAADDQFDLRIEPVAKQLGEATVRMLAYNGSVPGPTLRVRQGSELAVNVVNQGDLE